MDIERGLLRLLFCRIDPNTVLKNARFYATKNQEDVSYSHLCEKIFRNNSSDLFINYTGNEQRNIWSYLNKKLGQRDSVFGFVAEMAEKWLRLEQDFPCCRFEEIFRWRDASFQLGQDIFTTAFLAYKDSVLNQSRVRFCWPSIVKTDNGRLHRILDRGMAENHFHLTGSTQIFILNWISLMNHIACRQSDFKKMNVRLSAVSPYDTGQANRMYQNCKKAAFIRLYLFNRMLPNAKKSTNNFFTDLFNNSSYSSSVLDNLDIFLLDDLQRWINVYKSEFGYRTRYGILDYAYSSDLAQHNDDNSNRALCGERKFLYNCFRFVYGGQFNEIEKNLFYAYLLYRTAFRSELIQVNGRVGFFNFNEYQNRKEAFIQDFPQYRHELVRLAVNASMETQKIDSLEARICPKPTPLKNRDVLKSLDYHVSKKSSDDYRLQFPEEEQSDDLKYFYVLHFPKSAEKPIKSRSVLEENQNPRDHLMRKKMKQWTQTILRFLSQYPIIGKRVRGIDTCSNEIGCRPEVFAESYRCLTQAHIHLSDNLYDGASPMQTLRATYHAGEDFLDIADGLRAIDEAMLFLNLERGSRFGHALALGVDASEYYVLKNNQLTVPKQDMLDNIAWLLQRAKQWDVAIPGPTQTELENNFYRLYNSIFGHTSIPNIGLHEYFQSWSLRGDRPELYVDSSKFRQIIMDGTCFYPADQYRLNPKVDDAIRLNDIVRQLNYLYYFDYEVRSKGVEVEFFHVPPQYDAIITGVQQGMQRDLARKGIGIETNPSSNYLIGTIKRYDAHPIFRFNSRYLKPESNELPALSVSVNTDDQGVFDTMLENEYALIAAALEKRKDLQGHPLYTPESIYQYIDYLRSMGLEQVFQ